MKRFLLSQKEQHKTLDFIEKGFIPAEKLVQCKIKYIEQKEKLELMISPILK